MSLAMDNWKFDITGWQGHLDWNILEAAMRVAFADTVRVTHFIAEPTKVGYPDKFCDVCDGRGQNWTGGQGGDWEACACTKTPVPARLSLWYLVGQVPADIGGNQPIPLLGDLDYKTTTMLVEQWLRDVEYPSQPDHDGDNSKGWRVYNGPWSVSYPRPVCVIEPAWAMHGK